MVCLLAVPWVQLSVSTGSGWTHNELRHHWLMPVSCHFRDCKALLVTSLAHVSGTIASVLTFNMSNKVGDDEVTANTPIVCLHVYLVAPSSDCSSNVNHCLHGLWVSAHPTSPTFLPDSKIFMAKIFTIPQCANSPHGFSIYIFICKFICVTLSWWMGPKCHFLLNFIGTRGLCL